MPEVFLSYRQTSDTERQRVRAFAERLRASGIHVILDQFFLEEHPGGPNDGWDKWSSDRALQTSHVIVIGNESWFQCFDKTQPPGTGLGAACEADDIRHRVYEANGIVGTIRVVLFDDADSKHISPKLKRYHCFHANHDFDNIVRWLNDAEQNGKVMRATGCQNAPILPSGVKQGRPSTAFKKRIEKRWNARLLPCLIDSSYLQSAGRAISEQAQSQTDIDNFLRFLGEVVSHRDVAIVLATNGPVFRHSMEVVSQVNGISGRAVVRVIPGETINYSEITSKAIPRVRANIGRWICGPRSETQFADIAPRGGEVDLDIHEFLAGGAQVIRKWSLSKGGAKFLAHHILTHSAVVEGLRSSLRTRELPWTEKDTVRLCAAIRTECYFELADSQGLSYQPSLARYAIASRNAASHPILSIVGNRKMGAGELAIDLAGNERFLNALVTLGDFSPQTILGAASELSNEISHLRDYLAEPSSGQRGDAWVVWQGERIDQIRKLYLRMTREHQAVGLEKVLGTSDGTFVLGRPLDVGELGRLHEIITPLAAPVIVAAEHLNAETTERWSQFTWNCGLRK